MGKKGSWLSAIKRVFIPNSKEKLVNGSEKKSGKEKKKWGLGKSKYGETNSFIPLYREPSSIEKILGDAEREQQMLRPGSSDRRKRPPSIPPSVLDNHKEISYNPTVPTQKNHHTAEVSYNPTPTPKNHHKEVNYNPTPTPKTHHKEIYHHVAAAIKIQTAYRGYMARRSFRALKGLVRLQGVVRGQSVKRQTMNAMRHMQILVKVQTQIHSRRIQMLENQALQRHNLYKGDKELDSSFSKLTLTQPSETGEQEEWDDSVLTKEEMDTRLQRKVEAVIKRERALAYAYSHQSWKATPPKSAQTALMDIRSGGFPWWWNWLERQLPAQTSETQATPLKNDPTPPKPILEPEVQPRSSNYTRFGFEALDALTPKSSKSSMAVKTKHLPPLLNRSPKPNGSTPVKYAKPRTSRAESSLNTPFRDDDSLTSCPPFSVPNYMAPTLSAKAKVRPHSNPKERFPIAPSREQKRRLSFPLTPSIGSFGWNKGSLFSNKDSSSQRVLGKNNSMQSIGNLSVDSTVSLPAGVGRKSFK